MRAKTAILVFKHALSYDPATKQVVTRSGEHNAVAVQRWSFLGSEVPDSLAERRALGLLSPSNTPVNLPVVTCVRTVSMSLYLTEDMIPGSSLPDLPWPQGYNPSLDTLRAWMRTRHNMPMLSNETRKAPILKAVKEKLAVEAEMKSRGERILLRDPTGRSLVSYVLDQNPDESFHYVEDSVSRYSPPEFGWTFNLPYIQQTAPEVSLHLLYQHWEHRLIGAGGDTTRTILDDAMARVSEIERLVTFGYHENQAANEPQSTVTHGNQRSVLFKFSAPASFRLHTVYHVWVECSVSKIPGFHPFVSQILKCGCSCPIGSGGDCVHLLMLLLIVHFLPRPSTVNVVKPCTSLKCAWINPGGGDIWSVTTPVQYIPFLRQSSKKEKRREHRQRAASGTSAQDDSTTTSVGRAQSNTAGGNGGAATGSGAGDGANNNSTGEGGDGPQSNVGETGGGGVSNGPTKYCPATDTAGYRYRWDPHAQRDRRLVFDAVDDPERVGLLRAMLDACNAALGEPCAWDLAHWPRKTNAQRGVDQR